jgi:hypothetical protein
MKPRHIIVISIGVAGGLGLTLWLLKEGAMLFVGSDGITGFLGVLWVGLTIFSIITGFLCLCGLILTGIIVRITKRPNLKS